MSEMNLGQKMNATKPQPPSVSNLDSMSMAPALKNQPTQNMASISSDYQRLGSDDTDTEIKRLPTDNAIV